MSTGVKHELMLLPPQPSEKLKPCLIPCVMAEDYASKPREARRFSAILVAIIFIQTVLVECCLILWPALPLLLIPRPEARKVFAKVAGWGQAAWLGLAVTCLRFIAGVRIYIHTRGVSLAELQKIHTSVLMISNHPSRIDWMFHWALAIALGRLPDLKIVLKDTLRVAPGFGWAMQCNAYPFVCRKDRNADLETLRRTSFLGDPLAMLLFPEGTDLSDSNLQKSHAHAEKEGLSKYMQAGSAVLCAWECGGSVSEKRGF